MLLTGVFALLSGGCDRRSGPDGQGAGNAAAPTSGEVRAAPEAPPAKPAGAKVDRRYAGEDAPDFVFAGPDGKDATLAAFAGKPMLVNLWATWCGPCVAEMPMLDGIAAANAGRLAVLTISQDTGEAATIANFFARRKLAHLALHRDPENQFGFHYATGLLPTTVLYDRAHKEVARVAGALDWSGGAGQALIEEAMR